MSEAPGPVLQAEELLEVLERHGVEYVVVGGYAAQLHGSSRRTRDVDVVPATDGENLGRLVGALGELGARIRTEAAPDGLPFNTSAEALAGVRMLNLVTRFGELDLTFTPSGTEGFPDLERGARPVRIGAVEVQVASLADVIRSKTAAARSKDFEALPELHQLAGSTPGASTAGGEVTAGLSAGLGAAGVGGSAAAVAGAAYPRALLQVTAEERAAARIAAAKAQAVSERAARRTEGPGRTR